MVLPSSESQTVSFLRSTASGRNKELSLYEMNAFIC